MSSGNNLTANLHFLDFEIFRIVPSILSQVKGNCKYKLYFQLFHVTNNHTKYKNVHIQNYCESLTVCRDISKQYPYQ